MNVEEGSRRMRKAGRIIAIIALSVVLLSFFLAIVNALYGTSSGRINYVMFMLEEVMSLSAMMVIAGAALWIAGWIVKGFSQTTNSN